MRLGAAASSTSSTTTRATGCAGTWPGRWPKPRASRSASVIVNDDVAVQDSLLHGRPTRRGGQLLRHQGVRSGGRAEAPACEELVALGNRVNGAVRTMGVALTSCTPPAKGTPIFAIGDDEMEVGIGIHGEPGRRRARCAPPTRSSTRSARRSPSDLPFKRGDRVGADDQRPGRHTDQRAVPALPAGGQGLRGTRPRASAAATSATTARRWRWRVLADAGAGSTPNWSGCSPPRRTSRCACSDG